MTDLSASTQPTPPSGSPAYDDRMIAGITYVLFLLLPTFIPVLIGLVLAYAHRDTPSAMLRSHYVFQIRSFWMFFGWALIALAMIGIGIPLSMSAPAGGAALSNWFSCKSSPAGAASAVASAVFKT